jgi:AraC-like DNA-binding protein
MFHITSSWVGLLLEWLRREELAASEIYESLLVMQVDEYVPLDAWVNLLNKACALRPDLVAPGLEIGRGIEPRHAGVLGYLAIYSDSLGRALQSYMRYERLFYSRHSARFYIEGNSATLSWEGGSSSVDHEESTMSGIVTLMNNHMDQPLELTLVEFASPGTPERQRACEQFFSCEVRFSSSSTGLTGPVEQLMKPMRGKDETLFSILSSQADSKLTNHPENVLLLRLQDQIMRRLPEGEVSQDKLAEGLFISVRTLQRRLEACNTNWHTLLDNTRRMLSKRYLANTMLTLAEIALLVGYSEQSAFTRAFQRWENMSPSRYRKAHSHS